MKHTQISGEIFLKSSWKQLIDLGVSESEAQRLLATLCTELLDEELKTKLVEYGQEHTTSWLERGLLSLQQAIELITSLKTLDFQRISTAFQSTQPVEGSEMVGDERIEPPDIETYDSIESMSTDKIAELESLGTTEIAEGRAAVIILGGGQVICTFPFSFVWFVSCDHILSFLYRITKKRGVFSTSFFFFLNSLLLLPILL